MKKNIILIVITILFLSCSDNEIIPEVIIPEQSTPTTRSVGDGKYDALGFGYNCFYSNFSNPLYAKAQVIDLQKLEAGIGTDQLTGKKFIFNSLWNIHRKINRRYEVLYTHIIRSKKNNKTFFFRYRKHHH